MEFSHVPVFLNEAVEALDIKADGVYIDCTAGGGGHSAQIAAGLSKKGLLVCIDRDPDAIENLKKKFKGKENIKIVNDNFYNIKQILNSLDISGANGILADLGVSSHQLDTAKRGFSFHNDAPLDMRMSQQGVTAAEIINTASQQEIQRILYKYGEEKFAPSISRKIVAQRQTKAIQTTHELAEIVKSAVPAAVRRAGGHPARKTFQAIRIAVNGELDNLDMAIEDMFNCLLPKGRLAVITFHSLEDRPVKKLFVKLCLGCTCPKSFPVCVCGKEPMARLPFKAIAPSEKQIKENSRCRSARLRVIEKI
ncbi:MAG TPA: 16S rRNA (cytosine(1402)-N(4))-methyltransferase RsmH [Clostridia bacterium]|nr:16S rRNA (cytosine(1402)-N(4))-methyltransferase RsmH [Clostridia bacterium]